MLEGGEFSEELFDQESQVESRGGKHAQVVAHLRQVLFELILVVARARDSVSGRNQQVCAVAKVIIDNHGPLVATLEEIPSVDVAQGHRVGN